MEKIVLGNFIYTLRKEKNLSQSELGALLGVSNKAVSKWETCEANPELSIIPHLAEVLGVTTDELLSCERIEKQPSNEENSGSSNVFYGVNGTRKSTANSFEFVSDLKTKKGTPYVHINLGRDENGKIKKAIGVVAIGIIAKGILSIGIVSMGVISFGLLSVGILSLGLIALGLAVGVGGISVGALAVGGVAIGVFAVGGVALGVVSVGGLSIGVYAHTGEFGKAIGQFKYYHK